MNLKNVLICCIEKIIVLMNLFRLKFFHWLKLSVGHGLNQSNHCYYLSIILNSEKHHHFNIAQYFWLQQLFQNDLPGNHDNNSNFLFPYHPPKVIECVRCGTCKKVIIFEKVKKLYMVEQR